MAVTVSTHPMLQPTAKNFKNSHACAIANARDARKAASAHFKPGQGYWAARAAQALKEAAHYRELFISVTGATY